MHPAFLPENDKEHWTYSDIFEGRPLEFIKAFVHRRYAIGMHTHSFYEMNIVLNGSGWHYVESNAYPASKGCVFVLPAGIRHGYWQEDPLDVYHILINQAFFTRYADELQSLPGFSFLFRVEPLLRSQFQRAVFLELNDAQLQQVAPLLDGLLASAFQKEALKNAEALTLIGWLCSYVSKREEGEAESDRSCPSPSILLGLEYMQRHLDEKLTADKLADICHMSRSSFLRHFGEACRCTPAQFLAKCRLSRARELLAGSDAPLSAVAQACGYYDSAHFAKTFRAAEGVSPSEFRAVVKGS